jgi:ABC-type nitrate/sulfonate/bicarbonate transport system substrate-binding protein
MQAGAVAGGVATPPDITRLRRLGFRSLLDLAASGQQEMNNVAFAAGSWLRANEPAAQAFTEALVEGIHFAKSDRAFTEKVLGQYMQLENPEEIAEAYDHFVGSRLQRLPDLGVEAARSFLESQVPTDPRAASARPAEFFEPRFVDRARASGLVERLYGAQ